MRKYIVFLMALCLHSAARGQTGWQYWFDNDLSTLQTGTSQLVQADVSGLSESLHAIHIQVKGNCQKVVGHHLATWVDPDENIYFEQYVVDTEPEEMYSVPVTRYFVKVPQPNCNVRYWVDSDDAHAQTITATGQAAMLDMRAVSDGFHYLNLQPVGQSGTLGTPRLYPFIKLPQTQGVDHMTCLCIIDDQKFKQENVSASGGIISWNIDVSSLPQGFHRIYIQVVTPSGTASNLYQGFFFREATSTEFGEMKCYYALDGGSFDNVAGTMGDNTYHFDVDVSALSDGLHRISFLLSNGKGVNTDVQTHFFIKIPVGGYGITQYWYWLNEDDGNGEIMKLPVDPKQDPFHLVANLSLVEKPIRSKKFAFGFLGGNPTKPAIFAKNDLHMRFFDVGGRFTDLVREYVDERVYYELNYETAWSLLANNSPADLSAANAMQWYFLNVDAGNVLRFYLDHPATIQIFSVTTGREIYSAEGDEATTQGEIQVPANDTYYIVVHDRPESSYYNNVTLNYNLIGRLGDADMSGTVTIADAIAVVNHILGNTPDPFDENAADVNGDKKITISDAVGIVNIVLGNTQ